MWPQRFSVRGAPFGVAQRGLRSVRETRGVPPSFAWFCPVCGEVWCSAKIEGRHYMVWTVPCEDHQDPLLHTIPGSVWLSFEPEFLAELPPEMLRREFDLHIAYAEKELL